MIRWLSDMMTNPFLLAGMSSWLIAQVLKAVIHRIVHGEFDFRRLFGDGGMPSGHSATVTSVAIMSALIYGTGSFQFAISAIFAIIVCRDATGVRRETGKQSAIINELVKMFEVLASEKLPETKLKEFVGHTPVQVAAGSVVGACTALALYHFCR